VMIPGGAQKEMARTKEETRRVVCIVLSQGCVAPDGWINLVN